MPYRFIDGGAVVGRVPSYLRLSGAVEWVDAPPAEDPPPPAEPAKPEPRKALKSAPRKTAPKKATPVKKDS